MANPRLPNLTVQQLEYLVAAAASPTRAAAAKDLGVTPSALTQGLAELERRVGVPLFERKGRQTSLRPQATEVLAHARRVVAETRDLARWAETRRAGTAGTVRLGTIDAVAIHHRAATIRYHRSVSPGLDLRLTVAPSGALLDSLRVATWTWWSASSRPAHPMASTPSSAWRNPCTHTPLTAPSAEPPRPGGHGSPTRRGPTREPSSPPA